MSLPGASIPEHIRDVTTHETSPDSHAVGTWTLCYFSLEILFHSSSYFDSLPWNFSHFLSILIVSQFTKHLKTCIIAVAKVAYKQNGKFGRITFYSLMFYVAREYFSSASNFSSSSGTQTANHFRHRFRSGSPIRHRVDTSARRENVSDAPDQMLSDRRRRISVRHCAIGQSELPW